MTRLEDTNLTMMAMSERPPRFIWLGLLPLLLLALTAVFLNSHWSGIPAHFPVHWGAGGVADRWAERSEKSVYGPILFGGELCAWFMLLALTSWFGSQTSSARNNMLGMLIAMEGMMAILFSAIALQPLFKFPMLLVAGVVVVLPVVLLIVAMMKADEIGVASNPKPPEGWKAGFLYYNPSNPLLIVEKRFGIGYTFNFANPWSWVLMLLLAGIVASAHFVFA